MTNHAVEFWNEVEEVEREMKIKIPCYFCGKPLNNPIDCCMKERGMNHEKHV